MKLYIQFFSLYKKEVKRFCKVYNQTLISPIINSLLFLAIFTLAFGKRFEISAGLTYKEFIIPGLISMMMIINSFSNSASSISTSKILGYIIDYLIPPFSALNLVLAFTLAAMTRGIIVGVLGYFVMSFFTSIEISHIYIVILYFLLINITLALIGVLCGLYSNSFDQTSSVTSYIITPLSFLSGTFYSIETLPSFWYKISSINPFFYMIDGIRYGFLGYNEGDLIFGIKYLILLIVVLFIISLLWVRSGYRLQN